MVMFFYQLLLVLLFPIVMAALGMRILRHPNYARGVSNRFGFIPETSQGKTIWFHAVSAGEVSACAKLMRDLYRKYPDYKFIVTTMTHTGAAQVETLVGDFADHLFVPYDFKRGINRFFSALDPKILVIVETELWPNLIDIAFHRQVPVVVINARMSLRSVRGYRLIGRITREMLQKITFIAAQYESDMNRLQDLGAPESKIAAFGSVKFDFLPPEDHGERVSYMQKTWGLAERKIWIGASTHAGEEKRLLKAHKLALNEFPDLLFILVPRHPHRADSLINMARRMGFLPIRQSEISDSVDKDCSIIIADSIGHLPYLYGLSNLAFVGGSLVDVGGHNMIEPAALGIPIIMGPSRFNFQDASNIFEAQGALGTVNNYEEISEAIKTIYRNPNSMKELGKKSRQVVTDNKGATVKIVEILSSVLS